MLLRQTDSYIKICMNTWLLCEACIHAESDKLFPKEKLLQTCSHCSDACLAIVAVIIRDPLIVQQYAFDCFLYCRECRNECRQYKEAAIEHCGSVCNQCAETMKELLFNLN